VAILHKGKTLGERGIVRRAPRSLTAQTRSKTALLTLSANDFQAILGDSFFKDLDNKIAFIEGHIPHTKDLG
jgi:CRP-like cAMP-binding protein